VADSIKRASLVHLQKITIVKSFSKEGGDGNKIVQKLKSFFLHIQLNVDLL
jgi:hypothetical protein